MKRAGTCVGALVLLSVAVNGCGGDPLVEPGTDPYPPGGTPPQGGTPAPACASPPEAQPPQHTRARCIFFDSDRDPSYRRQIFRVHADGSGLERVLWDG